jgi:hypothetical protein
MVKVRYMTEEEKDEHKLTLAERHRALMRRRRREVRYDCPIQTLRDRHDNTKGPCAFTGCEKTFGGRAESLRHAFVCKSLDRQVVPQVLTEVEILLSDIYSERVVKAAQTFEDRQKREQMSRTSGRKKHGVYICVLCQKHLMTSMELANHRKLKKIHTAGNINMKKDKETQTDAPET